MLQFLLGLSDRQAAEVVRCRVDFTYALSMELDDPGFHHSVPADFRERIAQGDRADQLLDLALARLKNAGLVRERTTQRTDSTRVLAAVRELTRLELVTEAVRAALEDVARAATVVRSAWARTPPGPRPESSLPATTPTSCWNASTATDRATDPARRPRPCGGSSRRTTTATRQGACAGALSPSSSALVSALRHHRTLRPPRAHHPLEGIRRACHRDMRLRHRQRDHGCGHHLGGNQRCAGPARHSHPPGASQPVAR
ncbi:transposase [Embleya sp. NPDC056538]|uniref:transposase n=1 Tax=Embleya sp. NPDC056538 TaxID=3345858 RepID=UPI00367E8792